MKPASRRYIRTFSGIVIIVLLCTFVCVFFYRTFTTANENGVAKTNTSAVSSSSEYNPEAVETIKDYNKKCDEFLYLVNCYHPIDDDYKVKTVVYGGVDIDVRIKKPLDDMISAAKKDGIKLFVRSGYRSQETQRTLFNREVAGYTSKGWSKEEAYNLAKKSVAVPGTSEHQTGLAVDLNDVKDSFKNTREYNWLHNNCMKYGFIERYPEDKSNITGIIFEPWHYRYVGKEAAKQIASSDMCFEEYVSKQIREMNK